MATVRASSKEVGALLRAAGERVPQQLKGALRVSAERARGKLVSDSPVDMGVFKNAWAVVSRPTGVSVINSAPYAGIIERGARPHGVNAEGREAIKRWVMRKLLSKATVAALGKAARGDAVKNQAFDAAMRGVSKSHGPKYRVGSLKTFRKSAAEAEADRITQLIIYKLQSRGQLPKWIVRSNLPQFLRWMNQEIRKALKPEGKK